MILTSRLMQGPLCRRWCAAVAAVVIMAFAVPAQAVRIKDIATFSGVRDNQLIGYGLVVGLQGTGDKKDSVFTLSSMRKCPFPPSRERGLTSPYRRWATPRPCWAACCCKRP